MRRGLVLGCGGPIGFAWTAIALQELELALDWDARESTIIQGTSAGAEMAALLGAGVSVQQIVRDLDDVASGRPAYGDTPLTRRLRRDPAAIPPLPWPWFPGTQLALSGLKGNLDGLAGLAGLLPTGRGNANFLRDLGNGLYPDRARPKGDVRFMAADLRTGELVALTGDNAPIGDAIAASWAIPGWFPPVRIHGRQLLDGGTVSPTAAHLLANEDLDEVLIVAPMSTHGGAPASGVARAERFLRGPMTSRVNREQAQLEKAGHRVVRIEPTVAELDAMGANFMSVRRRAATLSAARKHVPNTIAAHLQGQS
ncbi:MAG TPA: patatin-like phospholipase family protein [Marmoricola sp.]|nr:patatin-like phospholipase family protein [Marmoricola sp.]